MRKLNILIIYSTYTSRANWLDSLYAFERYSNHNCYYFNARILQLPKWLVEDNFDLIIFHTLFFNQRWSIEQFEKTASKVRALVGGRALKIAMPQDEFIHADAVNGFLEEFGIHLVFSVQPRDVWEKIYGKSTIRPYEVAPVLTGYLDEKAIEKYRACIEDLDKREIDIGYRGSMPSPYWFGRHGMLKEDLCKAFNKNSLPSGLRCDISTSRSMTKLGTDFYTFMARCRYTIGVEGGTSILDKTGAIKAKTEAYMKKNQEAAYEEAEKECFPGVDGHFKGFALSPRHLEACMTGTCQILIEGTYNDILIPWVHYIPLKKDFSNLTEVIELIKADSIRHRIVRKAYQDIVESGRFTYRSFIDHFFLTVNGLNVGSLPRETNRLRWVSCLSFRFLAALERLNLVISRLYKYVILLKFLIVRRINTKHQL